MSDPDVNDRVTSLEVKIAYQEQLLADLDGVVQQFARKVDDLERRVSEMAQSREKDVGPADEPPPHY